MSQAMDARTGQTPALVNWLGYLALALLLALPAAVLMVRSGAWQQGLLVYAIACAGAAVLVLLAVLLMLLPRFSSWRKPIAGRALLALPGALLMLSLLGAGNYPRIHDISTDLQDPPRFTAAEQLRGPDSNSLLTDAETMAAQAQAYPDLQTLQTDLAFEELFERAVRVASDMGWEIYLQDANAGVIEAVDTTAIMGFKDDIVVRVRTNETGALIDLRSVSRVGIGDLGANAKRIQTFMAALQQQ